MMLELVFVLLFLWLSIHAVRIAFRMTWCLTKVIAAALLVLALPVMAVGLLVTGGILLAVPVIIILVVIALLKSCN